MSTLATYYLPEHMFFALLKNYAVFLDLRNDKYFCLNQYELDSFLYLIHHSSYLEENTGLPDKVKNIESLVKKGILTDVKTNGKQVSQIQLESPTADLLGYTFGLEPEIRIKDATRILLASWQTVIRFRCLTLEHIFKNIKIRKEHCIKYTLDNFHGYHSEDIKELVEIYNLLRPLFFSSHDRCLFVSLVLVEFLSKYDIYPKIVFGVKMEPFAAHCWVQDGSTILNDEVARTAGFTPILAI